MTNVDFLSLYSLLIQTQTASHLKSMDGTTYKQIVAFLDTEAFPENLTSCNQKFSFKRKCQRFKLNDGKLYHAKNNKDLKVVKENEVQDIIRNAHCGFGANHVGTKETRRRVLQE